MKVLVLSDSHSALSFMRRCIDCIQPEVVIHLGDYVHDGNAMAEEYPQLRFYQLPGNCDLHRIEPGMPEILTPVIGGVRFFLTHGHRHNVKLYVERLLADARSHRAQAVLYGHTHQADCRQEEDGLWVLNPGSCGYYGGSVGLMTVDGGRILSCRIVREQDLEAVK